MTDPEGERQPHLLDVDGARVRILESSWTWRFVCRGTSSVDVLKIRSDSIPLLRTSSSFLLVQSKSRVFTVVLGTRPWLLLLLSHFSRVRLCDSQRRSPPGSPSPAILQARTHFALTYPSRDAYLAFLLLRNIRLTLGICCPLPGTLSPVPPQDFLPSFRPLCS